MNEPEHDSAPNPAGGARFSLWRLFPVAILLLGLGLIFVLGLDDYVSFEALRAHRSELTAYVADQPVIAIAIFIAVYATSTALSAPGGAVLTVTGGFLFGIWLGTAVVVVGATLGATAVFLAARTALGDAMRARAGPAMQRMEAGFRRNALSYLLVLRLVPLFPFFLVNLVPAFLGVPLPVYFIGTLVGIIPGTFVYASIGAGLGSVFDSMEEFSLSGALTPEVITALCGLSLLSLLPVAYRMWKGRRTSDLENKESGGTPQ